MRVLLLFPVSIASALLSHASSVRNVRSSDAATLCCDCLENTLPGRVIFPKSPEFTAELSGYFSAQEAEEVSACRVNPLNTNEVAEAIRVITRIKCRFAVTSGGHMPWAGSANINGSGITIDLGFMNSTTVSEDATIAHVQPGTLWGSVYDALEAFDLLAAGARSMKVGVGGFLLGGGLSFLSPKYGFASNSVVGYQVVTVNGDVIEVNGDSHPDLFWALKVGSTNFGIITRYDLATYPFTTLWGGLRSYDLAHVQDAAEALIDFTDKVSVDGLGTCGLDLGKGDTLFMNFAYVAPSIHDIDVFDATLAIPFLSDTTRSGVDMQNLLEEIDALFSNGFRVAFETMSFEPDAQLIVEMYEEGLKLFQEYEGNSNVSWTVQFQPISLSMLEALEESADPQGLKVKDGALMLVNIVSFWVDADIDEDIHSKLAALRDWGERTAKTRGIWREWVYLNYASADQDPYASFATPNNKRLKEVRRMYDPDKIFIKLWQGGFKL